MKSIQDLAREAGGHPDNWNDDYFDMSLLALQRFHDAAIAQHNESLLAGVGDADSYRTGKDGEREPVYTADQMAAAVLREKLRTLEDIDFMATVWATYPELMEYLQAEIEAIRNTK